jgi:hypothetical protein
VNDFENYDPRMWLDKVLSRHPQKTQDRKAATRNNNSQLTRLVFPITAMASLFVMQDVAQPLTVVQHLPVSASQLASVPASPVYWLGTTPDTSSGASDVSGFEARAAAVVQQLRAGKLSNVPTETLNLARAAVGRARPESVDWIANVARDVARLTD